MCENLNDTLQILNNLLMANINLLITKWLSYYSNEKITQLWPNRRCKKKISWTKMTNSLCERSIWVTANILSLRILKSLIILVPLTFDFEALSSTYWKAAFRREILSFQSKKVIYVITEEFVIISSQLMKKQLLLTYFYIFQNY